MAVFDNTPGVVLSREQTAQIAYQAGARGDDLVFLTGIPERESSYRPGVHRTNSSREALTGDFGLYQINYTWHNELRQNGVINHANDLFDPLTNARAAMYVLGKQGRAAWASSDTRTNGTFWNANADPEWGWSRSAANTAVQNAAAKGVLGQDWDRGSSGESGEVADRTVLPPDARLVAVGGGAPFAVFDLGNGLNILYTHVGQENLHRPIQRLSRTQFNARYGGSVRGGRAEELSGIGAQYGSYRNFWKSVLDSVLPADNPGRNDPGVLRVLLEYAARPDMERSELENKLTGTRFFQTRTAAQLEWNDLSEAERDKRRQDTAGRMRQAWLQLAGVEQEEMRAQVIQRNLEKVASGEMSFNSFVELVVKPRAQNIAESPFARELREEAEATRQRGVDIENTTARIRDETERYGLQWNVKALQNWARDLVEKRRSDDDLLQALETQAERLYPGLGPLKGQDVVTAAAPWIETYERVMERKGTPFTPAVRKALAAGEGVWDMEQRLIRSPQWLDTANADERMHDAASQVGQIFGFV